MVCLLELLLFWKLLVCRLFTTGYLYSQSRKTDYHFLVDKVLFASSSREDGWREAGSNTKWASGHDEDKKGVSKVS